MRKTAKKKGIVPNTEASEDAGNDNAAKVSEQDDEVDTESVNIEVASNTRVRRGRRNAGKVSDEVANQGKKRATRGKLNSSESANEDNSEILDNEADIPELSVVCSQQSEKATEPNIPTNDAGKPTGIADKEDAYAAIEQGSRDCAETVNVGDKHNTSSDSSEEVSNITSAVAAENVTAEKSSNCDEVVSKSTKRENVDVESSINESEDAVENKRQKLDEADSKAGGITDTPQTDDPLSRKVFVGGLPNIVTEEKLREYFENFGRVLDINLIRDRDTNRVRGFAFVVFEKEDCANTCIQQKSHEICQKVCDVRKAHKNRVIHNNKGDLNRHPTGFNRYSNSRLNQQQKGNSGSNIQRMFQQAFLIGQRNAYRPPAPPSSRFLLNRPPIANSLNTRLVNPLAASVQRNNIFLQGLLNRQVPQPALVRPMVALPPRPLMPMTTPVWHRPPGNVAALNQLAQHMKAYTNIANKGPTKGAKHIYRPY